MSKKVLISVFCLSLSLNMACSSASVSNGNGTAGNSATANQDMPAGISTSPLPAAGTTPGIPDPQNVNMNSLPKGATPTPGIPDPKDINKPFKPGATPTPGIPDTNTLKKQLSGNSNVNVNQISTTGRSGEETVVTSDGEGKMTTKKVKKP